MPCQNFPVRPASMPVVRKTLSTDMLARADGRISDIAFACGFNDLSYFNRCFRRRFGLTPTAARGK